MKTIIEQGKQKEIKQFRCGHCDCKFESDEWVQKVMPIPYARFIPRFSHEKITASTCPNCEELTFQI